MNLFSPSIAGAAGPADLSEHAGPPLAALFGTDPADRLHYCTSHGGVFDDANGPRDMTAAMAEYATVAHRIGLAVYFHGGLVDRQTGLDWAGELIGPYSGSDAGSGAYPYFFVWETGLLEGEQRSHFSDLIRAALQLHRARDARFTELLHGATGCTRAGCTDAEWLDISAGLEQLAAPRAAARLLTRREQHRDHGLRATVVEELLRELELAPHLRSLWCAIKRAAWRAFSPDPSQDPRAYVGWTFVDELRRQFYDQRKYPRITLIGHSAGAIYICELLEALECTLGRRADERQITFDVVFMAPAVRFDRLAGTLHRIAPHRIAHFRMFGLCDTLELRDAVLQPFDKGLSLLGLDGRLYPHSLLYAIAGVCEGEDGDTPLLGMQRFHSGQRAFNPTPAELDAIMQVERILLHGRYPNAVIWSKADLGLGRRTNATRHGGAAREAWDSRQYCYPWEPRTLQSIRELLRTGIYS